MTASLVARRRATRRLFAAAALAATFGLATVAAPAMAEEAAVVRLTLKGNKFEPAEARAPANRPLTLMVKNLDPTPAEFESKTLRVEKIIAGGAEATINLRALAPGRYKFFDEYHEATTQGVLVVE